MKIKTFAALNKNERASALLDYISRHEDLLAKAVEQHEAMRMASQIGRMEDL